MKRFTCILSNAILAVALSNHTALAESQGHGQETYQTAEGGYGKTDQEIYDRESYVIGVGMPAGEYAASTEDTSEDHAFPSCTFILYKNDRDEKGIGTFRFQHHGLITLHSGQHLILSKGYVVPADQADISVGTTGMYKTGRDMEPGIYRLTPLTSDGTYYALYNGVRYYYDYTDDYQTFFGPATVILEEGQYIELTDVSSVKEID